MTKRISLLSNEDVIYSAYAYKDVLLPGEDDHRCHLTQTSLILNSGWWNTNRERSEYSISTINLPHDFSGAMCYFKANGESWYVVVTEADRMSYVIYDVSSGKLVSQGVFEEPVSDDDLM